MTQRGLSVAVCRYDVLTRNSVWTYSEKWIASHAIGNNIDLYVFMRSAVQMNFDSSDSRIKARIYLLIHMYILVVMNIVM
jgi:hypothetical protein